MTPKVPKPKTKSVEGFQPISSLITLSLILAFIGFQVYYLVTTFFAK